MAVGALLAAGCGDSGSDSGQSGAATSAPGGTTGAPATTVAQPVAGGKLTMYIVAETRGMDPVTVTSSSGLGGEPPRMHAVYDSLVITDNKTAEVKPVVAESLTSTDNIVWTLKIKPNVKFSDGTAYDAAAVKFNFDRHADPANKSTAQATAAALKTEVVDALTLKITLPAANGQFPRVVASTFAWTASPAAVQKYGKDYATTPDKIVGAGPFIVKEWTRDSKMVLAKNPNYWQAGKPYLDEITFQVQADETQRFNALNTGEADYAYLNTLPVQKQAKDAGLTTQQVNGIGFNGFQFNQSKEPFNDARLRKAVQLAIDPAQLNQVATDGLGEPVTSWFSKTSAFYDAAGEFPKTSATEAQKLIDAWVAEKGKNFEFTLTVTDSNVNVKIGEYVAATLNKLAKTKVTLQTVPQAQGTTNLRNKDYQMIPYAVLGADPEPQWFESWYSKGTRNFSGYNNPAMDDLLIKARNAADLATRKSLYAQTQKLLLDDGIPIILTQRSVTAAAYKASKVQGLVLLEDGGVVDWPNLWIKK